MDGQHVDPLSSPFYYEWATGEVLLRLLSPFKPAHKADAQLDNSPRRPESADWSQVPTEVLYGGSNVYDEGETEWPTEAVDYQGPPD